jgi:hypothetical protein
MDARQDRGLPRAHRGHSVPLAHGWRVPSQSGVGRYFVRRNQTCTCPDFERWQMPCKPVSAVEDLIPWKTDTAGQQTVVTTTEPGKGTSKQHWPASNAAPAAETARFLVLLKALCQLVEQPVQAPGRPRWPLADMAFACAYKGYVGCSSRRGTRELREAQEKAHIHKTPPFTAVSKDLAAPALTPIFAQLVPCSSVPLKGVETHLAVDAAGLSTCRFVRWCNKP